MKRASRLSEDWRNSAKARISGALLVPVLIFGKRWGPPTTAADAAAAAQPVWQKQAGSAVPSLKPKQPPVPSRTGETAAPAA